MFKSCLSKLAIIAIIFISLGVIGFLALPRIIDVFLLPPFLEKLPFSLSKASISSLTPYSINGSLELEHQQKPLLSIPQFGLRYSPRSLLSKSVDSLAVEHAVFHLYKDDGRWTFPGYQKPTTDSQSGPADGSLFLPLGVDAFFIKQCLIILHDPDTRDIHIGINGQVKVSYGLTDRGRSPESIAGSLTLFDDIQAAATFSAILGSDQITVQAAVQDAQWSIPKSVLPGPIKNFDFTTASADFDMVLDSPSYSTASYELRGSLKGFHYTDNNIELSGGDGTAESLLFTITGDGDNHVYDVSSIRVDAPLKATADINGRARLRDRALQTTGKLDLLLPAGNRQDSYQLPLSLEYTGNWSEPDGFVLKAGGILQPEQPFFLPEQFTGDPLTVELKKLSFASHFQSRGGHLQADFNLQSEPLRLMRGALELNSSNLQVQGSIERLSEQTTARIDGSLHSLTLPKQQISIKDIDFSLPIALTAPGQGKAEAGALRIDSVQHMTEHLFSLSADIELQKTTYRAQGIIETVLGPEALLSFTATSSLPSASADISWELAPARISSNSLSASGPMLPGLGFEAVLEAGGQIKVASSVLSAGMRASISDGVVEIRDKNIKIEDIDCSIEFPELPRLLSSPSQQCSTGSIDISSLHFDEGEIIFRLEDSPALFIEKSIFRWCDGSLEAGSLRLSKQTPEIDTTFYCSRINLGQLLEQFGFRTTAGNGSLNGKLPVKISNKRIAFDDGFLFSTPGAGGIVSFTNTELLRQGIGGVNEAGTINYTLKALEDFSYNWAKLSFDTIDDELLLALELDGKPRTAIPFKINKNGMIVESDQGAGLQHPIRLDVNFRLPLAELFQVGQSINSIMGNKQ